MNRPMVNSSRGIVCPNAGNTGGTVLGEVGFWLLGGVFTNAPFRARVQLFLQEGLALA